jgi:hypothetical protein
MVIIKHNRATLTVQPKHAESTRELLALIDKSKGRKGRKFKKGAPVKREHDSSKRSYPNFYPGMTTAEYIGAYTRWNSYLFVGAYAEDKILTYEHADRPAAMLDPSIPEVEELPCEQ